MILAERLCIIEKHDGFRKHKAHIRRVRPNITKCQPANDQLRDLGTEIVDIFVGPQRKRYVVHKKLLTIQSDYFDKALNGRFKEAEENSIYLKEEDPGTDLKTVCPA